MAPASHAPPDRFPGDAPTPLSPLTKCLSERRVGCVGLFCAVSCLFSLSMHFASAKTPACHAPTPQPAPGRDTGKAPRAVGWESSVPGPEAMH